MKFNLKDCSGCIYTRNPTHHPSLRVDLRQQASQIGDHVALMICHSFSLAATMGSNPQAPHLLPSKSIRQKLPLAYIAKGKSRVSGDVNIRECGVQGCARRMQWDSDLPDIQACTTPLQGLISHPIIRLENERAMWVCVGLSADNNLIIDPTNMISLDPKILSLLAVIYCQSYGL